MPKSENGTVVVGAMRIDAEVYEGLRREAEKNGRSITAQAERRLLCGEPDPNDVGRVISAVIGAVEARAGKSHQEDEIVRMQCRTAADFMLRTMLGAPFAENAMMRAVETEMDRLARIASGHAGILDQALGVPAPTPEEAEAALKQLQAFTDAQRFAMDIFDRALRPPQPAAADSTAA